jgi:hypothetical protein
MKGKPKMIRVKDLGSQAWPGGGLYPGFDLSILPNGHGDSLYAVLFFLVHLRLVVTVAGGGALTGIEVLNWITNITLDGANHSFVAPMTGQEMYAFNVYEDAKVIFAQPQTLAAGAAQVVDCWFAIRMAPPHCSNPYDFAVPCEMFEDGQFNLSTGGAAINGTSTVTACQLQLYAGLERREDIPLPSFPHIFAVSKNMDDRLPAGIYATLFGLNRDGGWVAGNIAGTSLWAGEEQIHLAVRPDALLYSYIEENSAAGSQVTLAEQLAQTALYATFADNQPHVNFLPLVWNCRPNSNKGNATGWVDTNGRQLQHTIQGTLATIRLVGRYYQSMDLNILRGKASLMGIQPQGMVVQPKTKSTVAVPAHRVALKTPGLGAIPVVITGHAAGAQALARHATRVLARH